jgi:hypothetical protein
MSSGRHGSGSSYVYRKGPSDPPNLSDTALGSPSKTTVPADRLKEIQAAVETSRDGIAVIFGRDHQVPGPSMHASRLRFDDNSPSWDHVAIAWKDANGNLVFAEARPVNGAAGALFFGKNNPGTALQFVTEYKHFKVLPIDLGSYGPGARDAFLNAVIAATGPGSSYSATNKNIGTVCSAVIGKGFAAAREVQRPTAGWAKNLRTAVDRIMVLGVNQLNIYTPKAAYLDVLKHSVPFRFDPNAPLVKREWLVVGQMIVVVETANAELDAPSPVLSAAGLESETHDLRIDDAPLQPATGHGKQASQQELKVALDDQDDEGDEDALTDDDSLQDPETDADDDEDDLEEEVNLASGTQDARTRDAPQQPEIDDDADDDDDDTLMDDVDPQPVIDDDDEDPAEEDDEEDELVNASGAEDPPADAPVMQTANAEAGADATADDEAGPQLASSAPAAADDGFSFSLFSKPSVPLEVAKEAMPAPEHRGAKARIPTWTAQTWATPRRARIRSCITAISRPDRNRTGSRTAAARRRYASRFRASPIICYVVNGLERHSRHCGPHRSCMFSRPMWLPATRVRAREGVWRA